HHLISIGVANAVADGGDIRSGIRCGDAECEKSGGCGDFGQ
ncbi:MAG: hypothetical protein ACJA1L_000689, partial [Paracoccaceae bacterium]